MISKSLSKPAFRSYVSKIEEEVNAYLDEFWTKDSDVIDFSEAIAEITIRTSTRYHFFIIIKFQTLSLSPIIIFLFLFK